MGIVERSRSNDISHYFNRQKSGDNCNLLFQSFASLSLPLSLSNLSVYQIKQRSIKKRATIGTGNSLIVCFPQIYLDIQIRSDNAKHCMRVELGWQWVVAGHVTFQLEPAKWWEHRRAVGIARRGRRRSCSGMLYALIFFFFLFFSPSRRRRRGRSPLPSLAGMPVTNQFRRNCRTRGILFKIRREISFTLIVSSFFLTYRHLYVDNQINP